MMNSNGSAKEVGGKIDSTLVHFAEKITERAHLAQDKVADASKYAVDYIKAHPVKSTLIAGGVCYLLGRLMK